MFVLLFGLMGVAAIFPVASHYILEGDKRDRSSGLAQVAFEELKARKILRPTGWVYATNNTPTLPATGFIDSTNGLFTQLPPAATGTAFVIDPLGSSFTSVPRTQRWFFPLPLTGNPSNPWGAGLQFPASGMWPKSQVPNWPVRRMTLPASGTIPMTLQTAETAFRLRDDLSVEQPDAGDRPSIQRWQTSGGQLLSRDYIGDYSWLATVVPTSQRALLGLQPAANIKDAFYEVTTVVFYKRDITPSVSTTGSPGSERLIGAEFINETELAIYDSAANDPAAVDLAFDGIKPTNWIAVMGVNQLNGVFMMKWYKVQAMDDTTIQQNLPGAGSNRNVRYLMVQGPDWPTSSYTNLRVAILPGAIDAYTRVMQVDVE
jgi:hypothetical protein